MDRSNLKANLHLLRKELKKLYPSLYIGCCIKGLPWYSDFKPDSACMLEIYTGTDSTFTDTYETIISRIVLHKDGNITNLVEPYNTEAIYPPSQMKRIVLKWFMSALETTQSKELTFRRYIARPLFLVAALAIAFHKN